jgi:hypothetical protein
LSPRGPGSRLDAPCTVCPAPELSYCRVDAAGVPAEWVEATTATEGQATIVYFVSGEDGVEAIERTRRSAGDLAVASGARVLLVGCTPPGECGIAAYAWLLGEGCDPGTTAFTSGASDASLVEAISTAARERGLPVPAAG